jgi:hypothetical protein
VRSCLKNKQTKKLKQNNNNKKAGERFF